MLNQISPIVIRNGILITSEEDVAFVKPPVYEVIRVMDGNPLFFEGHTSRLFKSLAFINLNHDLNQTVLLNAIRTLVDETNIKDNNVRLEVGEHQNGETTWILFWVKSHYPEKQVYENGVKTITTHVTRENPHAKIYRSQFVETINALKVDAGAFEVILVKEDGTVTEGSRSNLFFIKSGTLYSANDQDVLMGITRQKLLEMLHTLNIERVEMDIALDSIAGFEACFLTGTSIHILPICSIDDTQYASSTNPLILKLQQAFKKIVHDDLENTRRQQL